MPHSYAQTPGAVDKGEPSGVLGGAVHLGVVQVVHLAAVVGRHSPVGRPLARGQAQPGRAAPAVDVGKKKAGGLAQKKCWSVLKFQGDKV